MRGRHTGESGGGAVTLAVVGKRPTPGRVKTRLCPPLSHEQAAATHAAFLRATVARLTTAKLGPLAMCHAPDDAGPAVFEVLGVPDVRLLPQGEGDLGQRLARLFDTLRRDGPVLFLGADSPDLPPRHLAGAVSHLNGGKTGKTSTTGVIGPCDDGGFWCVGLPADADAAAVFAGIAWSSGRELDQVRANASAAGVPLAGVPAWSDVDRPRDLARLLARLAGSPRPADRRLLADLGDALGNATIEALKEHL